MFYNALKKILKRPRYNGYTQFQYLDLKVNTRTKNVIFIQ